MEQLFTRSAWSIYSSGAHGPQNVEHLITRSAWNTWSSCSSEQMEHLFSRSTQSGVPRST